MAGLVSRDFGGVEQLDGRGDRPPGHRHGRLELHVRDRHVRLRLPVAIHDNDGHVPPLSLWERLGRHVRPLSLWERVRVRVFLFSSSRRLSLAHRFFPRLPTPIRHQTVPRKLLPVGQHEDLLVGGVGLGQQLSGPGDLRAQVGLFVADSVGVRGRAHPLIEHLADLVTGRVEPALVGIFGPGGQQQRHLVAFVQFVHDLFGGAQRGAETHPAAIDRAHAGRVVQDDDHGRVAAGAPQRAEVGQRRFGQRQSDQQQRRHADQHQQQVVNPFALPGLLDADPQEPQRGEGQVLHLLAIDHVQHHGNARGQSCKQESDQPEGHGMFRLAI